jgi:hypothetical protein
VVRGPTGLYVTPIAAATQVIETSPFAYGKGIRL